MIETASWVSRGFFSLATLLATGSCFIACFTVKSNNIVFKTARRLSAKSTFVALAFAIFWAVTLAAELGGEWQSSLDPFFYSLIWSSPPANLLTWRVLALLALLSWATLPTCPNWIAMISAFTAVFSFTRYGHALGDPQLIKSILLTTHLSVISWWIAVVPVLLSTLCTSTPNALELAEQFARQAKWAIAVAIVSGFSFFGFQLAANQWNLDTLYFKTMLFKLIVVATIMFIGAFNHFRLIPALKLGGKQAKEKLRSVLLFDGALFVTVVLLSTWLTGPASNS